jgi:hypothetical protein
MATNRSRAAKQSTPTVSIENREYVIPLLSAAETYTENVRQHKLDALTGEIADTIVAAAALQPLYEVLRAETKKADSKATFTSKDFANRLTERGKVYLDKPDFVFPIPEKALPVILSWSGDQASHDAMLPKFTAWCNAQERAQVFPNYVTWLRGMRDKDGAWYNDDGSLTDRGTKLAQESEAAAASMAQEVWSGVDIQSNLAGMIPAMQAAFLQALIHDATGLLDRVYAAQGSNKAKVKLQARKIIKTHRETHQRIGVTVAAPVPPPPAPLATLPAPQVLVPAV